MSTLEAYTLKYEELPYTVKSGGKGQKMTKTSKAEVVPAKTYNKTRGEHLKDMVIVALVFSIIAFIGGMQFAKSNQAQIDKAVQAVTPSAEAQASK